jgi:hypothetical protein
MLTAVTNASNYDWSTWFMGIMRSLLSGGSASMVSGLASMGIAPGTFNLTNSVGNTLKLMSVMFLFQGLYRMFEFLQLHGAPDPIAQAAALQKAAEATKEAQGAIAEAKATAPPADK